VYVVELQWFFLTEITALPLLISNPSTFPYYEEQYKKIAAVISHY